MSEGAVEFVPKEKLLYGIRESVVVHTRDGRVVTGKVRRRAQRGFEYVIELDEGGRYYASQSELRKVS